MPIGVARMNRPGESRARGDLLVRRVDIVNRRSNRLAARHEAAISYVMADQRLNLAIAKIEGALARLETGERDGAFSPGDDGQAAAIEERLAEIEAGHEAALADRDRTIAKLRADIADVARLKDEEIAGLRRELAASRQAEAAAPSGVSEAEHGALREKYERLRERTRATLADLDMVIAAAERGAHG